MNQSYKLVHLFKAVPCWVGLASLAILGSFFVAESFARQTSRPAELLNHSSINNLADEVEREELLALKIYLKGQGIAMTRNGIREYLQQVVAVNSDRNVTEKLILQLGADEFSEREAAEKALRILPRVSFEVLREASGDNDFDKAFRARRILQAAGPQRIQTLKKVFRAIELLKLNGLTDEILQTVLKFQSERPITAAAKKAVLAAVSVEDLPVLSSKMNFISNELIQDISVESLRRLQAVSLSDRFESWARNEKFNEANRLQSSLALADLGDRRALNLLLDLMSQSRSTTVSDRSKRALQELTGQSFRYSKFENEIQRKQQLAKWKNWISANGQTAKLKFPLTQTSWNFFDGTLVAISNQNRVLLLDNSMKEIWSFECRYPVSAEKMDNGNILVAGWGKGQILEISPNKEIVRNIRIKGPVHARPLSNGNFLVSRSNRNPVEITPDGRTVWELDAKGRNVEQAIRLDNGNTLIAESTDQGAKLVAEFDPNGKRQWEYLVPSRNSLDSIQALRNGNILISIIGSAIEVEKKTKKTVWRLDRERLRDAFRLEDGNTLVLAKDRALEVDREGNEIWSKEGMSYGTIRR